MTFSPDPVITPQDLKFRFQLNKQLPTHIQINNPSEQRMAFKVKTTTPKKYCVRPSSGIIEPGSSSVVQVIMQAQKETPPDLNNCKDKFLVQTVPLNPGEDVTQDTFKKELKKDVKEAKLRVILEGPPAPPSPVPEANEGEEEPSLGAARERTAAIPMSNHVSAVSNSDPRLKTAQEDLADVTAKYNQLKSRLEAVIREKEQLKNKLDSLELRSPGITSNGPISSIARQEKSAGKWALIQLVLVAILAFLIGHYT